MKLALIDYGSGNVASVAKALAFLGAAPAMAADPAAVLAADRLVLPGVGSFGTVMAAVRGRALEQPLLEALARGTPFLGICVGLQMLFAGSSESPGVPGLKVLEGRVERFSRGKVPQVGWNLVRPRGVAWIPEGYYYFVNSYYAEPADPAVIAAVTDYHGDFASAVCRGNISAVQFHPEKSGTAGLELLRGWLTC